MRHIAITGASGLIGTALTTALATAGKRVTALPRALCPRPQDLADIDAVVNLAGAGLGNRRWNASYKHQIRTSRVDRTRELAAAIAACDRPVRLVSASAVGYYGDRGAEPLTEDSAPGSGFLAEVCRDWELAAAAAPNHAVVRTGIVLAPSGGALGRMLGLARLGLGGPLGDGSQYWPWISLRDHVRALLWLLDHPDQRGPFNLVSPNPLPQREIASELGRLLRRPAVLPAPRFALRALLGEFAETLTGGQRALPARLEAAGFGFDHPGIGQALRWVLGAPPQAPRAGVAS